MNKEQSINEIKDIILNNIDNEVKLSLLLNIIYNELSTTEFTDIINKLQKNLIDIK